MSLTEPVETTVYCEGCNRLRTELAQRDATINGLLTGQSNLLAELAAARKETERLRKMSTAEMMCENESVKQHVVEWENRCLKAEADLAAAREELNELIPVCIPKQDPNALGNIGWSIPFDFLRAIQRAIQDKVGTAEGSVSLETIESVLLSINCIDAAGRGEGTK